MERAHRQALEELQKQHGRQTRELEAERDRLLEEETQATAQGQRSLARHHGPRLNMSILLLLPLGQ